MYGTEVGVSPKSTNTRTRRNRALLFAILATAGLTLMPLLSAKTVDGWLSWRGPLQTGASLETNLPDSLELDGEDYLWSYPVKGGGAPVIADGRAYIFGYYEEDEGKLVEETLLCLDAKSGEKIWEYRSRDFLSDNVYNRYGIGSPCVDPETGNVYVMITSGLALAFDRDGNKLWEHSMLEEFWRLTFPNGRTGGPVVDGDFVVFRGITANWGPSGPPGDRFYGFEKRTGELAWWSAPDIKPVDSSNSSPTFTNLDERRVFIAGTGSGSIVCSNARTGEPIWRTTISTGGVNASVLLYGDDKVIAVHGKENIDSTSKGRMVCYRIPSKYPTGDKPVILGEADEVWRNDEHVSFSSSPTLHDGRIYTTIATGSLLCVDADTGKTLWSLKLGPDQLHASPLYADGKLYVPMAEGNVFVVKPHDDHGEIISEAEMGAVCLAAPSAYEGKVYVQTKEALHCFGNEKGKFVGVKTSVAKVKDKKIAALQVVPAEIALMQGQSVDFTVWGLNAVGQRVERISGASWDTGNLGASLKGNSLTVAKDARHAAGVIKASASGLTTAIRARIVAGPSYSEDFESFELTNKNHLGEAVSFPPSTWLGARVKWSVVEREGEKVITNVLDIVIKQRTTNFVGHHDMSDYTFTADVLTDGNRRILSSIGLVNQRYLIALVGNWRILEVSSNHDRLKQSVPFNVKANTWYTLKTKVKDNGDGSGVVMAKAWIRGEAEPDAWTIEVPVDKLHPKGAPAIYALSPQAQKRVYLDNLKINPNN
jgi:outer membrane protein assembly factor BamB